jgi:hypothetical protein
MDEVVAVAVAVPLISDDVTGREEGVLTCGWSGACGPVRTIGWP